MSEYGNYLIVIIKCDETNDSLKSGLKSLIDDISHLESRTIKDQPIKMLEYLGGDLKLLNQINNGHRWVCKYTFVFMVPVQQRWTL